MRETKNSVQIVGILSEINVRPVTYEKEGRTRNALAGDIKVRVNQKINNADVECEVPVYYFTSELTNSGEKNKAYIALETAINTLKSIAAVGYDEADAVRINAADTAKGFAHAIRMNEYWKPDGTLSSYPRIHATFISKIERDKMVPKATFEMEAVIKNIAKEIKNDMETGRLRIQAVVGQYNCADVVELVTSSPSVSNAVESYWNINDTVHFRGYLNFSSKTETVVNDTGFGEPMEDTRTIRVSELVISGGDPTPLEGEQAISKQDVDEALAQKRIKLENDKKRSEKKENPASKPMPSFNPNDLYGF